MKRIIAPLIALLIVGTIGVMATIPAVSQSTDLEPKQLRVIWTEDPARQATIAWTTAAEGAEHRVHFDTVARGGTLGDYASSVEVTTTGEYVDDGPFFHHASLADLEPDTEYFFTVETDGNASTELYFRTAHDDDRAFKLLYGGDSRSGTAERQEMNRRIARLHEEDPEILALVHGGDYINFANTWSQWTQWLDDHELTVASDGRVLPIVPVKGNHEGRGVVYNRVFANPGGSAETNWFFTQFGDLSLVSLDTEVSMAGDQRDWLLERLEEGRLSKWLVVNYHRPAFPAVKSPSGAREHWVPLFEAFDVDLVCESDGHALKRTPPIRDGRVDFTGVTYVGEGGLGVPQRTPLHDRWYLQSPGMSASAHHVQLLSFEEDLIRYQAVLMDGSVADEVTVMERDDRLAGRIQPVGAEGKRSGETAKHVEISFSSPFVAESVLAGDWQFDPRLDVERVVANSELDAVLTVVNTASFEELDDDAALDRRAATNIVMFRAGADGEEGTDDDRQIETWSELDDISFVGPAALASLSAYASANVDNPRNIVSLVTNGFEEGTNYRILIPEVEGLDGETVPPGTTLSFTYQRPDERADSLEGGGDAGDSRSSCATVAGADAPLLGLLFIAVVGLIRRRAI